MKKIDFPSLSLPILKPTKNIFESLGRAILYQQLSIKAAASIEKKFCTLFDSKKFPTPLQTLSVSDELLRTAGVSKQKAGYLKNLATHCLDKKFSLPAFKKMSDEEVSASLVAVKGVGQWTADMFLIFALNRPNILPLGDIGIHKGFKKVFVLASRPTVDQMKKLSMPYKGELTTLSLFLWKSVDGEDVVL